MVCRMQNAADDGKEERAVSCNHSELVQRSVRTEAGQNKIPSDYQSMQSTPAVV